MGKKLKGVSGRPELKPLSDPFFEICRELSLVKDHSRMLVLVTSGLLELLINNLIEAKLKNGKRIMDDGRTYPYSSKLLILHETSVISDNQYRLFDWFRKLRNRAAHEAIFHITSSDLEKVADENFKDPKNFYNLCFHVFGGLWNEHVEIFSPIFIPNLITNVKNRTEI